MTADIGLDVAEATFLLAHLDRLLSTDAAPRVLVRTEGREVAVLAAPPFGVISRVAVPMREPADGIDVAVRPAELRAAVAEALVAGRPLALPPAGEAPAELRELPPEDGWQLPIPGLAGDLVPLVDQGIAEFRARSGSLPAEAQGVLAAEVWDRPAWGGLPLRMLLAACRIGLLGRDGSRVAAATAGQWRRLTTNRGLVYATVDSQLRRGGLSLVR